MADTLRLLTNPEEDRLRQGEHARSMGNPRSHLRGGTPTDKAKATYDQCLEKGRHLQRAFEQTKAGTPIAQSTWSHDQLGDYGWDRGSESTSAYSSSSHRFTVNALQSDGVRTEDEKLIVVPWRHNNQWTDSKTGQKNMVGSSPYLRRLDRRLSVQEDLSLIDGRSQA